MIKILKLLQKQIDNRRQFAIRLINLKDDEQDILKGWSLNINDLTGGIELVKPKRYDYHFIRFTFNGDKFKFTSYKGDVKSFKDFRQGANWSEGFIIENGFKGKSNCINCNGLGKIRLNKFQITTCNCIKE